MEEKEKKPREGGASVQIIKFNIERTECSYDVVNITILVDREKEDLSDAYNIIDQISQLKIE